MMLNIALTLLIPATFQLKGADVSGSLNSWLLYQTDDVDSTTIAIVRNESGVILGIAVGDDIATECAAPRTCTYQKISGETRLDLERVTGSFDDIERENQGKIGGDSLLWNLGLNAKAQKKEWAGKIDGNFTTSLMENRALLGHDQYRFRFTNIYGEYQKSKWRLRAGRQHVMGGALVDGVNADFLMGPSHLQDSRSLGFFAGLAPDPITKGFSKDYLTFGPTLRWIPSFSETSESKVLVESSLISELYKLSVNRFYLFSRVHFTPVRRFSSLLYSNLELPWMGSDGELTSSLLSLHNYWRPNEQWFFTLGFSQFRIDRHLQEQGVRWVTENSSQSARLGETLDRSQRYRVDIRASVKPAPEYQPFVMVRYERRTFDSDKEGSNSDTAQTEVSDLRLLNKKNAYQGSAGVRTFLLENLETETSATYGQRFISKFYSFFQSASWDSPQGWSAQLDLQYVSSKRTPSLSTPNTLGSPESQVDIYAGLGGSYRFLSDFVGHVRYDFAHEDDATLDRGIISHTVLLRADYKF